MKKKLFLLVLVATVVAGGIIAGIHANSAALVTTKPSKGIEFIEQDWNKALADARQNNKLVFIDIYATWCGPCKMLKNKTFTDKAVADFFNANFVNVSVDAEKGIGISVSEQFAVSAYPTLVFTDKNGKPVLYSVGYMAPADLLTFAKAALKKS